MPIRQLQRVSHISLIFGHFFCFVVGESGGEGGRPAGGGHAVNLRVLEQVRGGMQEQDWILRFQGSLSQHVHEEVRGQLQEQDWILRCSWSISRLVHEEVRGQLQEQDWILRF
jgi:hypothetical protein